jgi:hypothetical protein
MSTTSWRAVVHLTTAGQLEQAADMKADQSLQAEAAEMRQCAANLRRYHARRPGQAE